MTREDMLREILSLKGSNWLLELATGTGISRYFSQRKKDYRHPNSNTYTITCSCDKADKLTDTLYKNATVFLDRKYNRYKKFSRYE